MKKNGVVTRIPKEAKEGLLKKQSIIVNMLKDYTKKDIKPRKVAPLTKVLNFYATKPTYIYQEEVIKYFLKDNKKDKKRFII